MASCHMVKDNVIMMDRRSSSMEGVRGELEWGAHPEPNKSFILFAGRGEEGKLSPAALRTGGRSGGSGGASAT